MDLLTRDDDVPCPAEGRRTPRELYVKLFVVNFTVLATYGHLLRMRSDHWYPMRLLLAFLSPIGVAFELILHCRLLVVQILACRNVDEVKKSALLLFGTIGPHRETSESIDSVWMNILRKRFRFIMSLAILSQCITSLWLFSGRVTRSTDALYDHRIFGLAVLDLVAACAVMLHDALQPRCPGFDHEQEPPRISWLALFRTCWQHEDARPGWCLSRRGGSAPEKLLPGSAVAPLFIAGIGSLLLQLMGLLEGSPHLVLTLGEFPFTLVVTMVSFECVLGPLGFLIWFNRNSETRGRLLGPFKSLIILLGIMVATGALDFILSLVMILLFRH